MDAIVPSLEALERRPYGRGDASGFRLVVTATGNPEVDGAVYADAEAAGVWVNSADDRAHSSFILPAVHRDGAVTVSVSTGGLSPALASWLRTRLAAQCGDGLGTLAQLLGDAASTTETSRVAQRLGGLGATARRPAARTRAVRRHRQRQGNCGDGHDNAPGNCDVRQRAVVLLSLMGSATPGPYCTQHLSSTCPVTMLHVEIGAVAPHNPQHHSIRVSARATASGSGGSAPEGDTDEIVDCSRVSGRSHRGQGDPARHRVRQRQHGWRGMALALSAVLHPGRRRDRLRHRPSRPARTPSTRAAKSSHRSDRVSDQRLRPNLGNPDHDPRRRHRRSFNLPAAAFDASGNLYVDGRLQRHNQRILADRPTRCRPSPPG